MEVTYFSGGYYLVEGSSFQDWLNSSILPLKFYSLSTCICDHHPDLSILPWVNDPKGKEKYRTKLQLSIEEFKVLQNLADQWFEQNKYAWSSVFLDLDLAREFAANYLNHLPDLKLLEIALHSEYRHLFLEAESSLNAEEGVYQALQSNQRREISRGFLGYEILGYDFGGFHSFVCHSLETDFANKLNIKLNQHRLIEQYDLAIKASDYLNHPDTGAEPVLWLPWAIIELDISKLKSPSV